MEDKLKRANEILGTNYRGWRELSAHRYLSEDFPGDLRKTCNQVAIIREKLSENGAIHHSFIVYDTDIKALEFFGNLLTGKYKR